jgi:hypothetical protein
LFLINGEPTDNRLGLRHAAISASA